LAIRLSWECLVVNDGLLDSDPLAIKLATRFAKAKINGVACGDISLHKKKKSSTQVNERVARIDTEIDAFVAAFDEKGNGEDPKFKEMQFVWHQWRSVRDECAQHSAEEYRAKLNAAASRLRGIPIYKCAT